MKTKTRSVVVLAVLLACLGLVIAADDPKAEAIKKDRKQQEGTWVTTALVVDGNQSQEEDIKKIMVINKDEKWTIQVDGKTVEEGTSVIDPTKKPKTIDFIPMFGEGENKGKVHLGIYEITGDTRKLCFAAPGKGRPTEFASKPGTDILYVEFKRVKP